MLRKDKYRREIVKQAMDGDSLRDFANKIIKSIDEVDLKSFNFERDPDFRPQKEHDL
jgi:hypothetical protein